MTDSLTMTDAQHDQLLLEWEVATAKIEQFSADMPAREVAILVAQGFLRPVARCVPDVRTTMLRFAPHEALAAVLSAGEDHVDLDHDLVEMLRENGVTWAEVGVEHV